MKQWPTPQDYNEAMQNPHLCFSDPDLKKTKIELNAMGLPKAASGAFASVYKATDGNTSWAVRCFLSNRPEQKDRYKHISDFVLFDNLDSTVDFYYLAEGVKVKGDWYPCLKMTWVEGPTLDQYIEKNFHDSTKMSNLLKSFHQMVGELEGAGIGHGDLQHGNIIVSEQGLRLVDYDALFVPALAGLKSLEFGHPNYQHPARNEDHYDPDVDNFSCWLIHASLLVLAIDPSVYEKLGGGDDCIIFKRKDLQHPESSQLFATLMEHESEHISETAKLLMRMLWAAPNAIPYLGAPPEEIAKLPTERGRQQEDLPEGMSAAEIQEALNEELSAALYDLDSGYDAIAASSLERQKRKPGATFNQLSMGTFKAGRQARDRIRKVAEKLEISTIPSSWINRKYKEGMQHFSSANYEESTRFFLEIFKQLNENRHGRTFFEVAISLGCSLSLSGNYSMAGNYFLVAYNFAKAKQRAEENFDQMDRAVFFLAISKHDDGNKEGAWKLLDTHKESLSFVKDLVITGNAFVVRESTFRMLHGYVMHSCTSPEMEADITVEFLEAASVMFLQLMTSGRDCQHLLHSYFELVGGLLRIAPEQVSDLTYKRARHLYMNISNICEEGGLHEWSRVAQFCAVVVVHTYERMQASAMSMLSDIGDITIDELLALATRASAFIEPPAILRVLLSVASGFQEVHSKEETSGALQVACQFTTRSDPILADVLVGSLDDFDQDAIAIAIDNSFFSANTSSEIRRRFSNVLATSASAKVKTVVAIRLIKNNDLDGVSDLFSSLATRNDGGMFQMVVIGVISNFATEGDRTNIDRSYKSCQLSVEKIFAELDEVHSIDSGDYANFPWNRFFLYLTALDNFRGIYKSTHKTERADEILQGIVDEAYAEILDNWFLHQVVTSSYDRYYSLAFDLADKQHFETLERLLLLLVRRGHTAVIDGITKNLTHKNHLDTLVSIASKLAIAGDPVAFTHISREIVRAAAPSVIIEVIESIFEKTEVDTDNFVTLLLRHLVEQGRMFKASEVVIYLDSRNRLDIVDPIAKELVQTSYVNSMFEALLDRQEFDILADLISRIAHVLETAGLSELMFMFKQGGVKDDDVYSIFHLCFEHHRNRLEKLLAAPGLTSAHQASDPNTLMSIKELTWTMDSLHNIRGFVARRSNAYVVSLEVRGISDDFSKSLSERYDSLIATWALHLARARDFFTLNEATLEMAVYLKDSCINGIVYQLTREGLFEALYGLTHHLIVNGHLQNVLDIAFQLAKHHTFEAKTVTAQIIKYTNEEDDLISLLEESALINDKLADMVVRQLALGERAEILRPIATNLAQQGKSRALYLVLTQLASTEDDFVEFITELCETIPPNRIATLAAWLKETGLAGLIHERVERLHSAGRADDARLWEEHIPQDVHKTET